MHILIFEGASALSAFRQDALLARLRQSFPELAPRVRRLHARFLHAVALDKSPGHRWLAKCSRGADGQAPALPSGVHRYAPMTAQLANARGAGRDASK